VETAASDPAPSFEPSSAEGKAAVRARVLLSQARAAVAKQRASAGAEAAGAKEAADVLEREAREAAKLLQEGLRNHPEAWPEVIEVASRTDDLKVALGLGELMAQAMEATGERLCAGRLGQAAVRGRQVAAAALAGGTSRESLTALADAAERDGDGGVRLEAVKSLAQRRLGASAETQSLIESALRRRADADADAYVRQVARNLVEPQRPPATRRPDPFTSRPSSSPAPAPQK
jgi:hypothetical protein